MQGIRISEEAELTENTNKPEPETPETPAPQPEPECTALVPTEPDVIEGEVIEIASPEPAEDYMPPKQTPYWLLIPCTILFCLLFVAASSLVPLLSPSATITILPVEKSLSLTDSMKVPGRELPPLTLMQSTTASATGKRHQPASHAAGTITFYNGLLTSQTIASGTIFTDNDGVQIITDQAAVIPAGNPPSYGQVSVSAHAVFAGPQGNIPAYAINTACCATSVVAKNTGAFSGGAAAREYVVVTRTDINNAVTSLLVTLSRSEDAALQAQLHPGEALITPSCTPHVASDHQPGDEAKHVSVTVSVTCTGIAYDANTLYQDATQLLTSQATTTLGATYSLIGDIQVTIVNATIIDHTQGIATLALKMDATYLYQIRPTEKEHLSSLLAGKPKQQAITTLLQFPGIQAASIHLAGGNTTLPADPHHIQIIVMYRGS
jgi:hypothetical protein